MKVTQNMCEHKLNCKLKKSDLSLQFTKYIGCHASSWSSWSSSDGSSVRSGLKCWNQALDFTTEEGKKELNQSI